MKTQDVDNLTVSIMTKKFNESFTQELLPEQSQLLQDYVFSIGKEELKKAQEVLEKVRKRNERREHLRNLNNFKSLL